MQFKIIAIVLCLLFLSLKLNAHEYWFEPLDFEIKVSDKLRAHEKVGSNFKGNEYAYLATSYESFNITIGDETRPIKSRLGDLPAVNEVIDKEGLLILSAVTTPSDLTYKTKEKFESFLVNQGLGWVKERHLKRGLPEKGFKEIYLRYPKSVVKVGSGKGHDKEMGLVLEWVLDTNPYTETSGPIKGHLLWRGKPLANKRVNVFNRIYSDGTNILANTTLVETHLSTDDKGAVEVPRGKGGLFLISAVHMIEPSKKTATETGAVWESLWASTTYRLP